MIETPKTLEEAAMLSTDCHMKWQETGQGLEVPESAPVAFMNWWANAQARSRRVRMEQDVREQQLGQFTMSPTWGERFRQLGECFQEPDIGDGLKAFLGIFKLWGK